MSYSNKLGLVYRTAENNKPTNSKALTKSTPFAGLNWSKLSLCLMDEARAVGLARVAINSCGVISTLNTDPCPGKAAARLLQQGLQRPRHEEGEKGKRNC